MRRVNLVPNGATATEGSSAEQPEESKSPVLLVIGQPVEQPADAAEAEQRGGVQIRQDLAQDLHGQPGGTLNTVKIWTQ